VRGGASMYGVYDNAHEGQTHSVGRPDICWELDFPAPGGVRAENR
jgi:hypothetical protein